MPARRAEDRLTVGGTPVPGPQFADQASSQRAPVLPPLTRGASSRKPPHPPVTTTHIHEHHDYGQGTPTPPGQRLGIHIHEHTHRGDASHSPGGSHPHRTAGTPGEPGAGMPSAGLASAAAGGETRARGKTAGGSSNAEAGMSVGLEDVDLGAAITAYLASQGVDVAACIRDAGYRREHQAQAASAAAGQGVSIARELKGAKRALAFEQEAFVSRRPGSGIGKVSEAQQRVDMLAASLDETCRGDPELVNMARQRAAR